MNNNARKEILKAISNGKSNNIKDSEYSVWEAIKYLRGYDTIENTNIEEKEITSESSLNSPWLSLNYFDPVVDINEDIIVPFYVTNYNHDEWMNDDYTTMFQIEIVFNGVIIRKIAHAGNNEINIGKCSEFGDELGRISYGVFTNGRRIAEFSNKDIASSVVTKINDIANNYSSICWL